MDDNFSQADEPNADATTYDPSMQDPALAGADYTPLYDDYQSDEAGADPTDSWTSEPYDTAPPGDVDTSGDSGYGAWADPNASLADLSPDDQLLYIQHNHPEWLDRPHINSLYLDDPALQLGPDDDGDGIPNEVEVFGYWTTVFVQISPELGYHPWITTHEYRDMIVFSDPQLADSDGDLLGDLLEATDNEYHPTDDSDGKSDDDGDFLTLGEEVTLYFTNEFRPDTDGDGYFDGEEVLWMGTNPRDKDDPEPQGDPMPGSGEQGGTAYPTMPGQDDDNYGASNQASLDVYGPEDLGSESSNSSSQELEPYQPPGSDPPFMQEGNWWVEMAGSYIEQDHESPRNESWGWEFSLPVGMVQACAGAEYVREQDGKWYWRQAYHEMNHQVRLRISEPLSYDFTKLFVVKFVSDHEVEEVRIEQLTVKAGEVASDALVFAPKAFRQGGWTDDDGIYFHCEHYEWEHLPVEFKQPILGPDRWTKSGNGMEEPHEGLRLCRWRDAFNFEDTDLWDVADFYKDFISRDRDRLVIEIKGEQIANKDFLEAEIATFKNSSKDYEPLDGHTKITLKWENGIYRSKPMILVSDETDDQFDSERSVLERNYDSTYKRPQPVDDEDNDDTHHAALDGTIELRFHEWNVRVQKNMFRSKRKIKVDAASIRRPSDNDFDLRKRMIGDVKFLRSVLAPFQISVDAKFHHFDADAQVQKWFEAPANRPTEPDFYMAHRYTNPQSIIHYTGSDGIRTRYGTKMRNDAYHVFYINVFLYPIAELRQDPGGSQLKSSVKTHGATFAHHLPNQAFVAIARTGSKKPVMAHETLHMMGRRGGLGDGDSRTHHLRNVFYPLLMKSPGLGYDEGGINPKIK